MGVDRRELRRVPGLRFSKLLGTGDGRRFTVRDADPTRWAMFSVWDDRSRLDEFERTSPGFRAWRRIAVESWRIDLLPLRWHGSWGGRDPFRGFTPSSVAAGSVAVLTRARIRPARWRSFWQAVPPVADASYRAPGRRFAIGIGEAPIGLQATFSLWDSADSLDAFAYRNDAHRAVIARTRTENWYTEELFARFAVLATSGTIDGIAV